ncbi:MAG: alpha-1,2-fucosyltransferase [Bacteroidetes bacterium]|nr:alpha-1,2-fucosyltransferase [Bacteroidota bacterium]
MILVSLHCQMGNQMFQYAFARVAAKELNTGFLPFVSNSYYPFKLNYFELDIVTRLIYSQRRIAKQFKRICRRLRKYVFKETITDNDWQVGIKLKNNTYYDGFFQSDVYFDQQENLIKKAFTVKKKYTKEFEIIYTKLIQNRKIIVVHVRRSDYDIVEFDGLGGPGIALPMIYYKKALSMITDISQYQVLFVGDDINYIKSHFDQKPNYHFETNSPIIDFQLIQHADIAIIANSTFAWWAAYLNQKENSRIIAPEYWLGHKVKKLFPAGIKTDKFEWIEF